MVVNVLVLGVVIFVVVQQRWRDGTVKIDRGSRLD
jgi:hypothetical protein